MSSIEFVQSSKSKTILVVDGYEYYRKKESKLTTAWNCAQYQTLSCRTSAITSGEQLISIRGNHNRDICLGKVGARKVSKKIKELSDGFWIFCCPDKVLIDFELAAMKVFEKALPNATLPRCFFHLSQDFIRTIGELGLKNLYHSNPNLSLAWKLIPALAFEKLENVKSSFKLVVEDIQE